MNEFVPIDAACIDGVFDRIGSIAVGKQADLLILSGETEPKVETVILRGSLRVS